MSWIINLSILDGTVKVLDLDTNDEFNLQDDMSAIPVKYIGFSGFIGHETKFIFNCSNIDSKISVSIPVERSFSSILTGTFANVFVLVTCLIFIIM